jgi:tetratricopeptide (TPR) repeat protein
MIQLFTASFRLHLGVGLMGMVLLCLAPSSQASTVHDDIHTFTRLIQANPTEATLYHGRGDAYLYLKEWRKAEVDYSSALRLNPENSHALYSRGLANSYLNQTHCALMDFGKALVLQPADADAHYNRGLVRVKEGDIPGAMFDYTRAIELNHQHAYAYYNRGVIRPMAKAHTTGTGGFTPGGNLLFTTGRYLKREAHPAGDSTPSRY